jgi:hypothetical protein
MFKVQSYVNIVAVIGSRLLSWNMLYELWSASDEVAADLCQIRRTHCTFGEEDSQLCSATPEFKISATEIL